MSIGVRSPETRSTNPPLNSLQTENADEVSICSVASLRDIAAVRRD